MKRIISFIYSVAAILMSTLAIAEEEGHQEPMTFLGDWLPRLFNFAIIAGVLIYFTRKPIRDFFKNRSIDIAKAMEESREARERAVAALAALEQKIKDMEIEAGKLVSESQARGEKDRQALIEEGRKVAAEIQTQVKQGMDMEVQKAKTALAVEAAILSVDLAEGKIKEKISHTDHERIVKEYIAKVGGKK